MSVLDLHHGPVVLDVPPASDNVALFGSAIDSWEVPLVDVGPTGEDEGKGGKYQHPRGLHHYSIADVLRARSGLFATPSASAPCPMMTAASQIG